MKLESGKAYRTQSGHKARCICDDVAWITGPHALCLVQDKTGYEDMVRYTEDGTAYCRNQEFNIVGEWEEPVVGYMAVKKHYPNTVDGVKLAGVTSHLYQTAEQARNSVDKFSQYAIVRVEFTPGVDQLESKQ